MPAENFLPENYFAEKAERRSSLLSLVLFLVIITGVVAAFFVTNRQWTAIKREQARINGEFANAARNIEKLNELEMQKAELLAKAEVAAALVERVPRSILLAELINRMPDAVTLNEFKLESKRERTRRPRPAATTKTLSQTKDKNAAAETPEERKVEVPKFEVLVALVGVAPSDVHVSDYIGNLTACPLFRNIDLKYSKEVALDNVNLREFRIEMILDVNADAKDFEPLRSPRTLRDPLDRDEQVGDEFPTDMTEIELMDEETRP